MCSDAGNGKLTEQIAILLHSGGSHGAFPQTKEYAEDGFHVERQALYVRENAGGETRDNRDLGGGACTDERGNDEGKKERKE